MKKGFTLIELLVVVLIIGILAAIALPYYEKAVRKSRTAKTFTLMRSIKDAEERYFMANGRYTMNFEELDITIPNSCKISGRTAQCSWNGMPVQYGLSLANFSHPNFYAISARENGKPWLMWQWQLDRAAIKPGKRICFPQDTRGAEQCEEWGGVPCGVYGGWYPGVTKSYCLPD